MKIAVAVSSSKVGGDSFIIWHGFEEAFAKARDFGYDGIELSLAGREDIQPAQLEKLLMKYNLEISGISSGLIFSSMNLYLTHPDKDLRARALTIIFELIDFASDFGQRINIGRSRGYYDPVLPKESCEAAFIDTLSRIVDRAASKSVNVLVEPVNRYEINFINSFRECAELIRWVPSGSVGILADLFHMNIEEPHIGESFVRYSELVKHIHFADSNRWAPGFGHLDFDEVFQALRKIRYDGWAAIEMMPLPTADEAAEQAIRFLRPRVDEHNRFLQKGVAETGEFPCVKKA